MPGGANNYTAGTVVHVTKWLSAFVNYGTTYNLPPISGLRLDHSVSPGVTASGWDYGLRFTLLNDKVAPEIIFHTANPTNTFLVDPPVTRVLSWHRRASNSPN